MSTTTLLADPSAVRLEKVVSEPASLTLVVRATRRQAECPRSGVGTTHIHSRYTRRVADLPWHGVAVRLELRVGSDRFRLGR